MKRLIVLLVLVLFVSSCYTVTRVGNCKYYTPKNLSSRGKPNAPIAF
jgi:hypothetical protein